MWEILGANVLKLKWVVLAKEAEGLSPSQMIVTFQCVQHCWAQHVAFIWPPCCDGLWCVETCWVLLAWVWKWSNFSFNICGFCELLYSSGQVHAKHLCTRTCALVWFATPNMLQNVMQHVVPNNASISSINMCRLFSQGVQILGQQFLRYYGVRGTVASWLVCLSPDRAVQVRALVGDIVLCSWARHFTLTVPLSTRLYRGVPAN